MAWDFETDADFQKELDWVQEFVQNEVEPLEHYLGSPFDVRNLERNRLVRPLQQQVKERGLWACHLSAQLGGQGYGQLKLALLNEILGRSTFGPTVFGCQAPDSGNAEILAHFGTPEQKQRYLRPLLENEIVSCFAMTEPQGGADPSIFTTRAEPRGDSWLINGEKWFASNARYSSFYIVLAVTDRGAPTHQRMSMFIVPAETPGIEIVQEVGVAEEPGATHAHVKFTDVRIPSDHMLGAPGLGFLVAQTRLGGGRIHHAMRTVGMARRALDMMCERVLSRQTQGSRLSEKQMVQERVADSWIELEQFRLLVLRTAWLIDKHKDYKRVLKDIAAVKAAMPKLLHDIAARALHLHGSLGVSREMPFAHQVIWSYVLGLADGPTEVHKTTVAKQVLRQYKPTSDVFPDYMRSLARERAKKQYTAADVGVNMDALKRWMDEHGLEEGPIDHVVPLTGGTQNILLRFRRGARQFVLRRPPKHPRGNSNETIRREARVLGALKNSSIPHPALVADCGDESVLGVAFYLMDPVEGFNPRGQLPLPHSADRQIRHRMGLALAEAIARLSRVDHIAVGLADFGKPEGFLQRQVARWRSQLDDYAEHSAWPGPGGLQGVDVVGDWLEAHRPQSFKAGILHGDYHLSNVMFRCDSAELAAIVDWELATIGDPLMDLGGLLATWPEPDGVQRPGIVGTAPWDGFPTAGELIERYEGVIGRKVDSVEWYGVLGCYKLGILLEGTYARACAGKASVETGERLHAAAQALFERAMNWANGGMRR